MNKRLYNWYNLEDLKDIEPFKIEYKNYILYDDGWLEIKVYSNIISAIESRLNILENYIDGKLPLYLIEPDYEMLKDMSIEERRLWYILKTEVE